MAFVRAEVAEGLLKWRAPLIYAGVALFGVLVFSRGGLFFQVVGAAVIAIGVTYFVTTVRRIGLRANDTGQGVVEIDERQVTYLSAFGGGAVSLDDLTDIRVSSPTQLVSAAQPYHARPLSRLWILRDSLGSEVQIPMDATNVDALVEAMLNLPQTQSALIYQAMRAEGGQPVVIWRRETSPLH